MAPYYPVTICRSDGQLETFTKSGIRELNQPDANKMGGKSGADGKVDYYRKIKDDDPKAIDWRRKLGGMLMHNLGGKDHADRNYILTELPTDYVLFEHVKMSKAGDDKRGKHAGVVYERQDAYLYGHPQGSKKRFRSPVEFFPHLLWLSSDLDGNPHNCSCKVCSPDEVVPVPVLDAEIQVQAPTKKENKPLAIPSAPKNAQMKPPPTSLPFVVRSLEQQSDSEPNGKYLYRPGELVWFHNGMNWRLGVISKRGLLNNLSRYLIQPLSNPLQHQPFHIKEHESSLRPWLAWSVPRTTIEALNNASFEQVPWDRVVRGDFDAGHVRDYIVDGSILSANQIDSSYSLFHRNENALAGPGEVHYNGMFLGAEKIWVGEPVRLRVPGNDNAVLIITKLIEFTIPPNTSSVTFVGDVYKFVEMPTPYKNRSEWPSPPNLPPRMIVDLRFRNEVADLAKKGIWYEWRLLEPNAKRGLSDVKGRWYETRTLLPILRTPQKFREDLVLGTTSDAGELMNGRMDKNWNTTQRRKNRKDTLGRAVPVEFKVSRGLDGAPADDAFPDAPVQLLIQPPSYEESDIDQFMDLDQAGTGQEFYGM